MTRACREAGGNNLAQGLSDLPSHPLLKEGAIAAIHADRSTYSPHEGIQELREAIAAKMAKHNGLPCDPATEVVVTVGSTAAFAMALLALTEPGDEVILFEPYYSYHLKAVVALRAEPVFVSLRGAKFEIDEQELRAAFTPRTRAIVVCTPSNPSGKVFTRDELSMIAELCIEHDTAAVTDEIYEYMVYDGAEHASLATLPGMRERTVTISGLSKTFSVTGWRLGYAVAQPELAHVIGVLGDTFYVCAPTPLQYGGARGLTVGPEYYTALREAYERRREIMAAALRGAGMVPIIPQGGYYMLADVSPLGWGNADQAAKRLLAEAGIAAVPGTGFYNSHAGDSVLRFCFGKDEKVLRDAAERLSRLRGEGSRG
jgi:aminotransferase